MTRMKYKLNPFAWFVYTQHSMMCVAGYHILMLCDIFPMSCPFSLLSKHFKGKNSLQQKCCSFLHFWFLNLGINIGFRGIVFPSRYNCNFIAQAQWKQTSLHYYKDQVVISLLWKLWNLFYRINELIKIATTVSTHQCTNFTGNW